MCPAHAADVLIAAGRVAVRAASAALTSMAVRTNAATARDRVPAHHATITTYGLASVTGR
jgi:hypothetical protein